MPAESVSDGADAISGSPAESPPGPRGLPLLGSLLPFARDPLGFLTDCAPALTKPGALVEGLHVFTFNQVAETEAWRTDLIRRLSEAR